MQPAVTPISPSVHEMAPTRVRYKVVAFAAALAGVTYLDRICISVLAPSMMKDLGLDKIQMGFVFSAFTLAYAAFEIPTAWWADRIGTRRVLTRIVAWWSAFTMLTAASFNYASLLLVRFLFGVGEAGAWPCAARTFSRWIPAPMRGKAQGFFFASAHLAGGLTPMIVTALLAYVSWRGVFVALGFVGMFWAIGWYRWFRDEPEQHPAVNAAEARLIAATRADEAAGHGDRELWGRLLKSPTMLALCFQHFANGYGAYFLMTWLPTYLEQQRGFNSVSDLDRRLGRDFDAGERNLAKDWPRVAPAAVCAGLSALLFATSCRPHAVWARSRWMRRRLKAVQSSTHSASTCAKPRSRKQSNRRAALMMPKTGSTVVWRCRNRRWPMGLRTRSRRRARSAERAASARLWRVCTSTGSCGGI
jgi:MFS family permease